MVASLKHPRGKTYTDYLYGIRDECRHLEPILLVRVFYYNELLLYESKMINDWGPT